MHNASENLKKMELSFKGNVLFSILTRKVNFKEVYTVFFFLAYFWILFGPAWYAPMPPGQKAPACSPNFSPTTTCNRHLTFGICDYFTVHDMMGTQGAQSYYFLFHEKKNENDHFPPLLN